MWRMLGAAVGMCASACSTSTTLDAGGDAAGVSCGLPIEGAPAAEMCPEGCSPIQGSGVDQERACFRGSEFFACTPEYGTAAGVPVCYENMATGERWWSGALYGPDALPETITPCDANYLDFESCE